MGREMERKRAQSMHWSPTGERAWHRPTMVSQELKSTTNFNSATEVQLGKEEDKRKKKFFYIMVFHDN